MGSVYRAGRVDGEVRQVVAIKILEREWLDPKLLERFRRERQILSGLAHPNITRLLDTGTRADGRPYLVMEFIEGEPLDQYCAHHDLDIAERLRLFLPVCRAVEYAHSKLVIHRDLKPSNILVTRQGEPKLLDFGIARALDEAGAQSTNTVLLTPHYASPDLARGDSPSTAMDVYGLGAVLYQLLTGTTPHQVAGLSPIELVRHLTEVEPAHPSAIRPSLQGDLENIIRTAMHREPERRYRSVRELADDIERYLTLRPVRATPDRLVYRAGRFVARRRWLVAAASIAVAAIATGAFFAATERRRAGEEAAIAKAVSEFLQNDLIGQAGLRSQIERGARADADLKVRTILERAATSVPVKFRNMPKVEAAIRVAIGGAYRDLGLDQESLQHFRRALDLRVAASGPGSSDSLAAARLVGDSLSGLGKREEAHKVFHETIAVAGSDREGRRAAAHARYGIAMIAGAEKRPEALLLLEKAIAEISAVEGPEHESTLTALNQLGVTYWEAGRAKEAEPLFRRILETRRKVLGPMHPDTLGSMSELGVFLFRQSRLSEGEELLKQAASGMESVLGPDHPVTLSILMNLTFVYTRYGQYAKAEPIRMRIYEAEHKLRGPDHPDTLVSAANLAVTYYTNGKFAAAARLQEATLSAKRRVHGDEHPATIHSLRSLVPIYREMGKLADSARVGAETVSLSRRLMGEHVDTATAMNELARTKKSQRSFEEAERILREVLAIRLKLVGPQHHFTLLTQADLAGVLLETGRLDEAEHLFLDTLAAQKKLLGELNPATLTTTSELAALYHRRGSLDSAASLRHQVLEGRRKVLGAEHPFTLCAMRDLAATYREQRRLQDAQPLLAAALRSVSDLESRGETILGLTAAGLRREHAQLLRSGPAAR
jgi:tetratricopeptide (TPR) repeat protein/tRNA A-37 threonylcarbamoyl transferase component Bud32